MSRLSPRELDVLRAAAQGLSRRQTAEQLRIGRSAVKRALLAAVERLGAASLPHAVALAMARQLIKASDIPSRPAP